MKKLLFPFVLLLFAVAVQAQIQDPVKFNSELKILAADEAEVVFTAAIVKGWHVYSTDLGDGGPISANFNVEKIFGAEVVGKLKPVGKEISTFDKLFEMKVRYFENTDKDQRLLVNGETAQWCVDHKIKCVGFGDGVSIENCNEDVKPFHDICMAENIVFLEVLKNLDKLTQDTFFMSYSPLPIYGLDSCPIRAYAIEGLAEFAR